MRCARPQSGESYAVRLPVIRKIKRVLRPRPSLSLIALILALAGSCNSSCHNGEEPPEENGSDQMVVAAYIRENLLEGEFGERTLWMTETALDGTHVARDTSPEMPDIRFPFPSNWLVMIDDQPEANWGHSCRWVFVNAGLSEHTEPLIRDFPPRVFSNLGEGPEIGFTCVDVTPTDCP